MRFFFYFVHTKSGIILRWNYSDLPNDSVLYVTTVERLKTAASGWKNGELGTHKESLPRKRNVLFSNKTRLSCVCICSKQIFNYLSFRSYNAHWVHWEIDDFLLVSFFESIGAFCYNLIILWWLAIYNHSYQGPKGMKEFI